MNIHQYITSAQIPVLANKYEKALVENCIGEYGVCIDEQLVLSGMKCLQFMVAKILWDLAATGRLIPLSM